LQHSIEPQIRYRYIPDSDQEGLPLYDLNDRIGRISLFDNDLVGALNFSNTPWSTASRPARPAPTAPLPIANSSSKALQAYDIAEERDAADDDPEPFSDLRTELGLYPTPATSLTLDARLRSTMDPPSRRSMPGPATPTATAMARKSATAIAVSKAVSARPITCRCASRPPCWHPSMPTSRSATI